MAPPLTRIYPRLTTAALSFVRKPAGALGVWSQAPTNFIATKARYAGPDVGTTQQGLTPLYSAIPNATTHSCLVAQVLSDPLKEQTVSAGPWRIGFALALANAGANFTWRGRAALFVVNGQTGERRATIFDTSNVGTGSRTVTTERTCLDTITGSVTKVMTGDYLCLELGMAVTNAAAALAPQITLYADGPRAISSDDAALTDVASALDCPAELLLSLPTTGEQASASVSFAEAVRIIKEHWPKYSEVLYDWDSSDAHIKKIFDWLGDAAKLYGWDQVDRLFRESNPLSAIELLPAWETVLGVSQSRAAQRGKTISQRRQLVLARLRERGPLTLFRLAATFAILAQYGPGTQPDVLEMSASQLQTSNKWVETQTNAIPAVAAFDSTNLIRETPTLLDGGDVWATGVLLILRVSAADTTDLRVQLMGPDFTVTSWGDSTYPLPSGLATTIYLRSTAFAGKAIHGSWKLWVRRIPGSPNVDLEQVSLYVLGRGWGGRSGAKFVWSVHIDAAHQTSTDRRAAEAALDRMAQSHGRGFCIYNIDSVPGTAQHRPGRFVPGPP